MEVGQRHAELQRVSAEDREVWATETKRRARHVAHLLAQTPGRSERIAAEWLRCASDPLYWIRNYGWLSNPKADDVAARKFPFVPWPKQVECLSWIQERLKKQEVGITPKSREIGITWLFLHFAYHQWLFSSGFSCHLGSRTEKEVDNRGNASSLFERIRFIHSQQPWWLLNDRDGRPRRVEGDNGPEEVAHHSKWVQDKHCAFVNRAIGYSNEITGEATSHQFARGSRKTMVVVDEAAAIKADVMAGTWRALESVAKAVFLVYNPGSKQHLTYELHKGKHCLHEDQVFPLDWRADPRRGERFKQDRCLPRGPLTPEAFAQEYELAYGAVSRQGRIYDATRSRHAYDDATLPEGLREGAPLYGAWDFGSGASLLCCLFGLFDYESSTLWIDNELTWQQTDWKTAAPDALAMMSLYGNRAYHFGDPAGIQRDSAQTSWNYNLRAGGIPLYCLPGVYNTSEQIEWGFKLVQQMLDEGRLRIHYRCADLWRSLDEWTRNIPAGIPLDHLNKTYVAPRKDVHSHHGMALCYFALGLSKFLGDQARLPVLQAAQRAVRTLDPDEDEGRAPERAPRRRPNEIASVLSKIRMGNRTTPRGFPGSGSGGVGGMLRRAARRRGF